MSDMHQFILNPGKWVGEGTVSFSNSDDQLFFVTKWEINRSLDEGIYFFQEVKTEGVEDPVQNSFHLYDFNSGTFTISLSNSIIGKVIGTGVIDEKTIAWEFRQQNDFQGFEVYTLKEDAGYSFHAEYTSPDQFRTLIDGRIQKK